MSDQTLNDFCRCCGARIPPIDGEGTCPQCDPEGCRKHQEKLELAGDLRIVREVFRYREGPSDTRVAGMFRIEDVWVPSHSLYRYHTDPAADYLVLVEVRKNWNDKDIFRFATTLHNCWDSQSVGKFVRSFMVYQRGDYSRAALAVIDKKDTEQ